MVIVCCDHISGVFLHVLADTLGSVFVIISTLLIQYFEWKWVDPLCSLILSMLILASVYPLLMASTATLMQCIPPELEHEYDHVLCQVKLFLVALKGLPVDEHSLLSAFRGFDCCYARS